MKLKESGLRKVHIDVSSGQVTVEIETFAEDAWGNLSRRWWADWKCREYNSPTKSSLIRLFRILNDGDYRKEGSVYLDKEGNCRGYTTWWIDNTDLKRHSYEIKWDD